MKYFLFSCGLIVLCLNYACSDPVDAADEADVGAGDISEDTVDDEDIASADAVDDEDTGPKPVYDEWIECDCPNPDDECSPSHCGIAGSDCSDDGESCPDGYKCQPVAFGRAPICICDGSLEECAHPCEDHADCPSSKHTCDFERGRCRGSARCNSDIDCPDGMYCDSETSYCDLVGDGELGESCESPKDCASGYCYDDTCSERCRYDADCGEGHACFGTRIENIRCVETQCEISCPETMRCFGGTSCEEQYCYTSGDCVRGDCATNEDSPVTMAGRCVEPDEPGIDRYCKADEYYWGGGYCSNLQICWSDEDCDPPYQCGADPDSGTGATCGRHYQDL